MVKAFEFTAAGCADLPAPRFSRAAACWLAGALLTGTALRAPAQGNEAIYTDSLQNGWANYSWATVNFANTNPVHSGSDSISVLCLSNNYQALYLHQPAFDSTIYTNLTFWINGGTNGGQHLQVQGTLNGAAQTAVTLAPLTTNWQQIAISLVALGVANQPNMDGFWIQSQSASPIPVFYVDDIALVAGLMITNTPVSITVDAQANRNPISPMIYGTAFASSNQLSDLNFVMNRSGGNEETTYNWQLNAHGKGNDYYFENYADSTSTPGGTADDFVANSKNGSAHPMITLPMIGWSPKLGAGRGVIWSYSVAKYGPQTATDPYHPDAGNGMGTNPATHTSWVITTNDPTDTYFPTNVLYQQQYVQHLMSKWGGSTNGGVGYYLMDNEHSLWSSTHQDIHPVGPTMQEIWSDMLTTAGMVKSNDPNALVLGPEEWGWPGYFYSGYDQQWSGQHNDFNPADYPDRKTNGGWDYMPWLLNQFHQHDINTGQRLLDFFTLHCYPQEGTVSTSDSSPSTALLRNQSTRQFWDSNYVDPSWINSIIMLIPRMKNWAATNYPGTKIGVTEYNWGAETNISGATAQADLLGIFGKYGLDLATRWTTPATGTPTYNAMKIYRNYDGNKSTFGDTSVSAAGQNPDVVSTFAAVRSSDGALTIMAINKQLTATATTGITFSNFLAVGTAQVWQLNSTNVITHLGNISVAGNSFSNTLPAQSITLFVLPAGVPQPPVLVAGSASSSNTFDIWLNGQAAQTYVLQTSSNLASWSPLQTNKLASNSLHIVLSATNGPYRFYRAAWVP